MILLQKVGTGRPVNAWLQNLSICELCLLLGFQACSRSQLSSCSVCAGAAGVESAHSRDGMSWTDGVGELQPDCIPALI